MSRIINCGFIMLDYNACNAWLNLSKVKSQVRYGALDFFYENKARVTFLFTNNNWTIKRYWYHSRNDKLQTKLRVLSCSWAMSLKWKKKWKRLKLFTNNTTICTRYTLWTKFTLWTRFTLFFTKWRPCTSAIYIQVLVKHKKYQI